MKKDFKLIVFSTFIGLVSLVPQTGWSMQNKEQINRHNVKTIIDEHLKKYPDLMLSSKDKDIVVFLGNTGAGKSTLINYLSEKELICDRLNNIVLKTPTDNSAMSIGTTATPETFLPQFIHANNWFFFDLPGFMDTRGPATSLLNAAFIKSIIENAKSTKIVFVAGMGQIDNDRGASLINLVSKAERLIPGKNIVDFSALVITKCDSGMDKEIFFETIESKVDGSQLPILKSWLNSYKIENMSKPYQKLINQSERSDILQLISSTGATKVETVNTDEIYNHSDKETIKAMYDDDMRDIVDGLVATKFRAEDLPLLEMAALTAKKQYFQDNFAQEITSLVDKNSFITLLRTVSGKTYELSLIKMKQYLSDNTYKIVAAIDRAIDKKKADDLLKQKQIENDKKIAEQKIENDRKIAEQKIENDRKIEEQKTENDKRIAEQQIENDRKMEEQRIKNEQAAAADKAEREALQREIQKRDRSDRITKEIKVRENEIRDWEAMHEHHREMYNSHWSSYYWYLDDYRPFTPDIDGWSNPVTPERGNYAGRTYLYNNKWYEHMTNYTNERIRREYVAIDNLRWELNQL